MREGFAYFSDANGLLYFMGGSGATTNMHTDTYDAKNAVWGSGPTMTALRDSLFGGTTLALTGSSFAPNATVTASIAGQTVGTATTDATGTLASLTVTLPSTVGAVTIQVVDNMSNYPVTVNVTAQ